MKGVARANQRDSVDSKTGVGDDCKYPVVTSTGPATTSKVFIEGIPAVREDDRVGPHNKRGCDPDESVLTSFSSKVSITGKGIGRLDDKYTDDNIITSASSKVFAN